MSLPTFLLLFQLATYVVFCVIMGAAICSLLFRTSFSVRHIDRYVILGYAAGPLLIGVVSLFMRTNPGYILLFWLTVGVVVLLIRRRSFPSLDEAATPGTTPVEEGFPSFLRPMPGWATWLFAIALAVFTQFAYLLWALEIPAGDGTIFYGTTVHDFDKHLSNIVAIARTGVPAEHPFYPGLPLVYYSGFYMVASSLAGLLPMAIVQAVVAHFFLTSVVYVLIVHKIARAFFPQSRIAVGICLILLVCGLTVGWRTFAFWKLLPGIPVLEKFWTNPNHPNPVGMLFQWVPQHVVAIVYALLNLVCLRDWPRLAWRSLLVWIITASFLISCSIMVGFIYVVTIALQLMLDLLWPLLKRRSLQDGYGLLRQIFLSGAGVALLSLPHYYTLYHTILFGSRKEGCVFRITDNLLHNIGFLVFTCGLGLIALAFTPILTNRYDRLRGVVLLSVVSLGLAVSQHFNSEMLHKSLCTLQIALPLLMFLFLAWLWSKNRAAGLVIGAATVVNASLSFSDSHLIMANYLRPEFMTARRDVVTLVDWIKRNTALNDVVTMLDGRRATWNYLTTRTAALSYSRLNSAFWTDSSLLSGYMDQHANTLQAIADSDYVYLAHVNNDLFHVRRPPRLVEENKALLALLKFETVIQTKDGLVAKRTEDLGDAIELSGEDMTGTIVHALAKLGYYDVVLPASVLKSFNRYAAEAYLWVTRHPRNEDTVSSYCSDLHALLVNGDLLQIGGIAHREEGAIGADTAHKDLCHGLAESDLVMYFRGMRPFVKILQAIRAEKVFDNLGAVIYRVDDAAEARLQSEPARVAIDRYDRTLALGEKLQAIDSNSAQFQEVLSEYIRLNPEDPNAVRAMADRLWARGQHAEVVRRLKDWGVADLPFASISYCMAFSLHQVPGQLERAIHYYTRALELGFSEFWVRYNRGSAYDSLGRYEEALEDHTRALALQPSNETLRQSVARLKERTGQ